MFPDVASSMIDNISGLFRLGCIKIFSLKESNVFVNTNHETLEDNDIKFGNMVNERILPFLLSKSISG